VDRQGAGDDFELQFRCMLPKYVWPQLKYPGWTSISQEELIERCKPYAVIQRRKDGHAGGMPPGAAVCAQEALHSILAGQNFGYAPELLDEPLFVSQCRNGNFSTKELKAWAIGQMYAEVGDALCLKPGVSGLNSGRRNCSVTISKRLDETGRSAQLVKKIMNHRGILTSKTFDAAYDDSTATTDMGALLMGRSMSKMEQDGRHWQVWWRSSMQH